MFRKSWGLPAAGLVVSALAAPAANAAVIFNSLTMTTATYATAKRGTVVDTRSDSKTTTTGTLPFGPKSVTSAASALVKTANVTRIQSNATSTVTASLGSADFGSFDMTTVESVVQSQANSASQPISGQAKAGSFDVGYRFTVIGPKLFTLTFALTDPNFVGSSPVLAALSGPLGGFSNNLPHNSSGSIATMLNSGNYFLHLASGYEAQIGRASQGIGTTTGGSFDHFDFSIASVPEPSTWALLIAGFGVIGFAMRRNRMPVRRMSAARI